jgi:hypothetical protein
MPVTRPSMAVIDPMVSMAVMSRAVGWWAWVAGTMRSGGRHGNWTLVG